MLVQFIETETVEAPEIYILHVAMALTVEPFWREEGGVRIVEQIYDTIHKGRRLLVKPNGRSSSCRHSCSGSSISRRRSRSREVIGVKVAVEVIISVIVIVEAEAVVIIVVTLRIEAVP